MNDDDKAFLVSFEMGNLNGKVTNLSISKIILPFSGNFSI